jgi:hypothetical protein
MLKELSPGVEVIFSATDSIPICHIIRASYSPFKTEFFTPGDYSQQLGVIKYHKGGLIKPHFHNRVMREVHYTQEVLIIRKGKVKVNLYDNGMQYIESVILNRGDVILLASGGHGFEMLEDCEMFEIKQGPYSGTESDKTHIE